ncbi:hypothetical protein ISS22_00030 [candidate division KSB1 bacterium]|nr:hypothetical protein [candidate division KSB1 bacterium]
MLNNFICNKKAIFILVTILYFLPNSPAFSQTNLDSLIHKVQIKSQNSYDSIDSVLFSGHTKSYVYFSYGPFDLKLVPYMEEYYFDGYWIKPDSIRMVIKAQRIVAPDSVNVNIGKDTFPIHNPFHYLFDPSLIGFKDSTNEKLWPFYPFALGADSLYYYEKINEIGFGDNKVVTVSVAPKDNDIPAVHGTYQLDVNKNEVVGSDVLFNEATSFVRSSVNRRKDGFSLSVSGSENHKMKTKKALLYGNYWLPTNLEEEFDIRIMGISVKINRIIEFESYIVNPTSPDSTIIKNKKIIYLPDSTLEKKLFADVEYPSKLSREEQEQLIKKIEDKFSAENLFTELIESESIAKQAFRIGLEQKFGTYFRFAQDLGKYVAYNRVEGLRLNYGIDVTNPVLKNSVLSIIGGYGFKDQEWKAGASFLQYLDKKKKIFLEGNLYRAITFEENKKLITTGKNSFTSLLYKGDYRDYYYKTGSNFGIGFHATDNLAFKISAVSQNEDNATIHTRFSIFKYKEKFRSNPGIIEGRLNGIRSVLLYRLYNFDFDLSGEFSNSKYLHSDFSYGFLKSNLQKKFRPTYHSNLNLFLSGAYSSGELPPQKWFDFGGKTFINYYGNLRGVNYKAFTGDKMIASTLEYSINGSALYSLGMKLGIIKALKLTLWNGLGWSSLSAKNKRFAEELNIPTETTTGIYHELGIGISDRLNIFRIDLIRNTISKNIVQVSLNVLR